MEQEPPRRIHPCVAEEDHYNPERAMRLHTISTLLLTALVAASVVGCKKKMDRVTPLPGYGAGATIRDPGPGAGVNFGNNLNTNPNPFPTTDPNAGLNRGPEGQVPLSGSRSIEGRPQDREKYAAQVVYFDFDRSNIRTDQAAKVQEVANRFKTEDPGTDLLVEGHCDERGTEEYNRSLGERRALAIREMLVALGVPADRIHTVSFGKDKPVDPSHTSEAWQKNRRGEFILVLPR
jgi:peptidoglycan-associated lipoprotein